LRLLIQKGENVLQALDLLFGLRLMSFKCLPQLRGLSCRSHLGQRLQDLMLGEVDIFQGVKEETLKVLLGHDRAPGGLGKSLRAHAAIRASGEPSQGRTVPGKKGVGHLLAATAATGAGKPVRRYWAAAPLGNLGPRGKRSE
jgi:hypothetical protein